MNQNTYIQNGVLVISSKSKKTGKKRRGFLHSLCFRLVVATTLLTVIPLFILRGTLLINIHDKLWNERMYSIEQHCSFLARQIMLQDYFNGNNTDIINNLIFQLDSIYDGRVIVVDDTFTVRKDSYSRINKKKVISPEVMSCMNGESTGTYDEVYDMLVKTVPVTDDGGQICGVIIINASTNDLTKIYASIRHMSTGVVLGFSVILIVLSALIGRAFTKPFKGVAKSINRISEGYFDEEVHLKGYAEIETISDAFNVMLNRLKSLEDSRQEFVSNVSHELKTPITSIKVLADSLNMQEDVPVELYRDFMKDIVEEIDRENTIINDLLALVKMDKKSGDLNISSVNINDMLELILKRLRPIAAKRNIELVLESFRTVVADCDEVKLTLAFSNLVENGIKYNIAGGWVQVSLDADHKYFYVKVSDSGIGIAQEYQEKIFDRFYRVDKARSRETGGTGLGLAITKNIILMHDGAIRVKSKEDEGTTFTVRIPINYVQ